MRLESVRELKAQLAAPAQAAVARAPELALGIAPWGGGDFRLAVRVQRPELLRGPRIDEITRAARGEVDVRFVGRIVAQQQTERVRPLRPGYSVGHHAITAGTLGAFVRVAGQPRARILSNNHVLANEDRAAEGDEIIQPGSADGGRRGADRIGALERFVGLERGGANLVDAAIAVLDEGIDFDPELAGIGHVREPLAPEQAERVVKLGRTTGRTGGTVSAIEVDNVTVQYTAGTLRFDDQIEISGTNAGPFSAGGDSGSLIAGADAPQAVGLLFAGSEQGGPEGHGVTFANPIATVLAELEIEGLW